jgi:hypothetical protein
VTLAADRNGKFTFDDPESPMAIDGPDLDDLLGSMTVTGTHIRDAVPIGSNLLQLDRQDIDCSGYFTVQDIVRSLPQNVSGGVKAGDLDSPNDRVA